MREGERGGWYEDSIFLEGEGAAYEAGEATHSVNVDVRESWAGEE